MYKCSEQFGEFVHVDVNTVEPRLSGSLRIRNYNGKTKRRLIEQNKITKISQISTKNNFVTHCELVLKYFVHNPSTKIIQNSTARHTIQNFRIGAV